MAEREKISSTFLALKPSLSSPPADKAWESRWTTSVFPGKSSSDMGSFKWTSGEHFLDASDKGIQTSEDAKFYGISAKLSEAFTNKDKDIVVQFSVKHEQELDCGGAYLKLTGDIEQDSFSGDSPYQIMFGPDICGPSNQKTHVIFHYPPKKDNLLIKNDVSVKTDSKVSHLYTLHVKKDSSFEVFIDQESVREGKLESEFDFLLPKEIKDPAQSKPKDWVDDAQMPDPADKKPAGWDDIPAEIPDPDASKVRVGCVPCVCCAWWWAVVVSSLTRSYPLCSRTTGTTRRTARGRRR